MAATALLALVAATEPNTFGGVSASAAKLTKTLKVNAQLFRNAPFRVRVGMDEPVTRVKLWVKVSGTVASNLQLRLRSPGGKEIVVHDRTGGSADTIELEVPTGQLAGMKSGGEWALVVDDQTLDIKQKGAESKSRLLSYQLNIFYKGNDTQPGMAPLGAPAQPAKHAAQPAAQPKAGQKH